MLLWLIFSAATHAPLAFSRWCPAKSQDPGGGRASSDPRSCSSPLCETVHTPQPPQGAGLSPWLSRVVNKHLSALPSRRSDLDLKAEGGVPRSGSQSSSCPQRSPACPSWPPARPPQHCLGRSYPVPAPGRTPPETASVHLILTRTLGRTYRYCSCFTEELSHLVKDSQEVAEPGLGPKQPDPLSLC